MTYEDREPDAVELRAAPGMHDVGEVFLRYPDYWCEWVCDVSDGLERVGQALSKAYHVPVVWGVSDAALEVGYE